MYAFSLFYFNTFINERKTLHTCKKEWMFTITPLMKMQIGFPSYYFRVFSVLQVTKSLFFKGRNKRMSVGQRMELKAFI